MSGEASGASVGGRALVNPLQRFEATARATSAPAPSSTAESLYGHAEVSTGARAMVHGVPVLRTDGLYAAILMGTRRADCGPARRSRASSAPLGHAAPTPDKGAPRGDGRRGSHDAAARAAGRDTAAAAAAARADEAERIDVARSFVHDALEGRGIHLADAIMGARRRKLQVVLRSRAYRLFVQSSLTMMLLLAFWEAPEFPDSLHGVPTIVPVLEAFALVVAAVDVCINIYVFGTRLVFKGEANYLCCGRKGWETVYLVCIVVGVVDYIVFYAAAAYSLPRVSRVVRPFMLVAKKKEVRRLLAVMLRTMPKLLEVVVLFLVLILAFAILGMNLFNDLRVPGYSPDRDNFNAPGSAILAMYVLTTSENYPSVMYPAIVQRPALAVAFFATACFAFLWVIVPLVLATVYDVYTANKTDTTRRKLVMQHKTMIAAYHVLVDDGTSSLQLGYFRRFMQAAFGSLGSRVADKIFNILDTDKSGSITVREWLRLPQLIRLQHAYSVFDEGGAAGTCCARCEGNRAAAERRRAARRAGRCGCLWRAAASGEHASHFAWRSLYVTSVLTNVVLALAWTADAQREYNNCVEASGPSACLGTFVGGVMCAAVASMLLMGAMTAVKAVARPGGVVAFWQSKWNRLDCFVLAYSLAATGLMLLGADTWSAALLSDALEASRALRVLFILSTFRRLRRYIDLVSAIVKLLVSFGVAYFCLTYSFAVVGMWLFGKVPNTVPPSSPDQYTFATFGAAILALTQLTVGNDWNTVMYGNLTGTSKYAALYFVAYFMLCTSIVLNIIIGVVVDEYQGAVQRAEEEAAALKESQRRELEQLSPSSRALPAADARALVDAQAEDAAAAPQRRFGRATLAMDKEALEELVLSLADLEQSIVDAQLGTHVKRGGGSGPARSTRSLARAVRRISTAVARRHPRRARGERSRSTDGMMDAVGEPAGDGGAQGGAQGDAQGRAAAGDAKS